MSVQIDGWYIQALRWLTGAIPFRKEGVEALFHLELREAGPPGENVKIFRADRGDIRVELRQATDGRGGAILLEFVEHGPSLRAMSEVFGPLPDAEPSVAAGAGARPPDYRKLRAPWGGVSVGDREGRVVSLLLDAAPAAPARAPEPPASPPVQPTRLMAVVSRVLTLKGLRPTCTVSDRLSSSYQKDFGGRSAQFQLLAREIVERDQVVIHSVCPVSIPDARKMAVVELITRINSGMVIGNFEMNLDDGELLFKTSLDCERSTPEDTMFASLITANEHAMSIYFPAIVAVALEGKAPREVLG